MKKFFRFHSSKVVIRFFNLFLSLLLLVFSLGGFPFTTRADQSGFVNEARHLSSFSKFTSDANIEALGHVSRLSKYDLSLDTVGYENADGTQTVYLYQSNVKYVDEKGFVREKDTSIVKSSKISGYEYSIAGNDITPYYLCWRH